MTAGVLDLRQQARQCQPDLSGYPRELFASAIGTWRARMHNEWTSHRVFEKLTSQLEAAGFNGGLQRECLAFADEERQHGVLCGAVVEALGGEARVALAAPAAFPDHADAPPRAALLRNLIHVCCMSETVAVALIGAERLEMPDGSLRALLDRIYADEIGHARFGWRLLEEVGLDITLEERTAIERYLPVAFEHLAVHEISHLPDLCPPPGGETLGLCSGRDARMLFGETVREVIRPGLARWFVC